MTYAQPNTANMHSEVKRVSVRMINRSRQWLVTDPIVPVDKIMGPLRHALLEKGISLTDSNPITKPGRAIVKPASEMPSDLFISVNLIDKPKLSILSVNGDPFALGENSDPITRNFADGVQEAARKIGRLGADESPGLRVIKSIEYELVKPILDSAIFFYKSDVAARVKDQIQTAWQYMASDSKEGKPVDINDLIGRIPAMHTPKNDKLVGIIADILPLLSHKNAISITIGPVTHNAEFKYADCAETIANGILRALGSQDARVNEVMRAFET